MTDTVVATAFGGPEVLALVDLPLAPDGPDKVVVDVRASGANPIDVKLYGGEFGTDAARLPMRLGFEASGVVAAAGDGAEGPAGPIRVGDEVIVRTDGSYAAQLRVPAAAVWPKPASLSFEQASGLLLTGSTAVHLLAVTAVHAGDTVVVHGAGGGVGMMVVQLAVDAGARVIGTASAGQHGRLRSLGAEPVTYGEGLVERLAALAPAGIDAAIDTVGSDEAVETSVALVADRQRIATIAAFGRAHELGIKLLGNGPGADPGTDIRERAPRELLARVEAGALQVIVAGVYPFAEATRAHRELASGHAHGKIVVP
jgi:NADPH:quinone reductase-like Zn-dependent oxidoreductase